jgi:phosphatidylinositol phospholipase C delta
MSSLSRAGSLRQKIRRLSNPPGLNESLIASTRTRQASLTNTSINEVTAELGSVTIEPKPLVDDVVESSTYVIPEELVKGMELKRITHRKRTTRIFSIDPSTFSIVWDNKSSSRCAIHSIEDIREGEAAKFYRESLGISSSLSSRWVTIFYNDIEDGRSKPRLIHIIAPTIEAYRLFVNTVRELASIHHAQAAVPGLPHNALLQSWNAVATSPSDKLGLRAISKILNSCFIFCPTPMLQQKIGQLDPIGSLDFKQFKQLILHLKERPEISSIFQSAADITVPNSNSVALSRKGLETFYTMIQKSHPEIDQLDATFTRFALPDQSGIDLNGFTQLLLSDSHMPLISPKEQDLTLPLTEYLINTSHNTYLLGRQIAGVSSIEPYIQVLSEGCRCVEIDVWDGEEAPIVNHGRTFSSSISFESVIEAINEYGFRTSPLPVILSFEIHCNFVNQAKMVEIMKRVFGDKLVTEPLMSNMFSLPSPLDLKYKILVKVKPGSNRMGPNGSASLGQAFSSFTEEADSLSSDSSSPSSLSETETDAGDGTVLSGKMNNSIVRLNRVDAAKCSIINELGDLGVYCQGIKYRNFSLPISKTVNHCFSLSENAINKMIKDEDMRDELVKHNKKFFMRIYPSAYRVTSSNYDPILYWKHGSQMVALNWQSYGMRRTLVSLLLFYFILLFY